MTIIDKINKKYSPKLIDGKLILTEPIFNIELVFEGNKDEDEILDVISLLDKIDYIKCSAILSNNYFEILVNLSGAYFADSLSYYDFSIISDKDKPTDKIWYEIGEVSFLFSQFLDGTVFDDFTSEGYYSIRVYNLNKVLEKEVDDDNFYGIAVHVIKSIFFYLSYKYNLNLIIIDISEGKDYPFPNEFIGETNVIEDYGEIYNVHLLSYYYRATQLDNSEFKFLAYFQVLECLFDEVYNYKNIKDIRSIINSNWFSLNNDSDVFKIIEIVERYSKEKNDRQKTMLVLEKYFKQDLHEKAFIEVNKDITKLLIEELKLFENETELNDLQKLANIIYDFRCLCTHSNKIYKKRLDVNYSDTELNCYINLIKKIAEKIIINYGI